MELAAGITLAETLMDEHDLDVRGWTFSYDRAEHRLGLCSYGTKTISMGRKFVEAADVDTVRQTMLHEIAHALIGSRAKHGYLWQAKARAIGYTGSRLSQNPHQDNVRAAALVAAQAAEAGARSITSGPLTIGERVVRRDGTYSGLVVSVARTRCTVKVDGRTAHVIFPIVQLNRENGGLRPTSPKAAKSASTAPVARPSNVQNYFFNGQDVVIAIPRNKLDGARGTVESVGPKNCVVLLESGTVVRCPRTLLRSAEILAKV